MIGVLVIRGRRYAHITYMYVLSARGTLSVHRNEQFYGVKDSA